MSENTTTPDQPTSPIAEAQTEAPAAAPSKRRGRTAMIAGGATLGALLLVGGGVAIGAAVADDRDDDGFDSLSSSQRSQTASDDVAATTERTDDDAQVAPAADFGAGNAGELSALVDAAKGVADGEPTAIDANRDGTWDVTLTAGDGAETEVRITADGTAAVHETEAAEADDRAPRNVLDAATLTAMVDAALAEQPGRILEIDADDDNRSPFDVSVLTGDRQVVDITLDASGSVIASEIDD